jgi:hypothetical protein
MAGHRRARAPPTPKQASHETAWLLWRRALQIHWRSLEQDEASTIDACMAGHKFGELCERLCEWVEESSAAFHAASMLKRWMIDGLLTRIDFE